MCVRHAFDSTESRNLKQLEKTGLPGHAVCQPACLQELVSDEADFWRKLQSCRHYASKQGEVISIGNSFEWLGSSTSTKSSYKYRSPIYIFPYLQYYNPSSIDNHISREVLRGWTRGDPDLHIVIRALVRDCHVGASTSD
jgi:hypothetical protein